MPRPDTARARLWLALAALALLSLVALFAYAPIFAVDFFWHLKLGQLIAQMHAVPDRDLFSAVHPERHFVQFQWLWELLVYGAYTQGGLRGVRLFQVVTLTVSFAVLGLVSVRALSSRVVAFCFCALALVLFEDRFQARPSATMLGFVALMLPWLLAPKLRDQRAAWWLSLLLGAAWSNIHGGESLLWPLCLGALTVGAWLDRKRVAQGWLRLRRDATLLGAACLGTALSPAFSLRLSEWQQAIAPQVATGNKEFRPSYTMLENGLTPSHLLVALAPSAVALLYLLEQRRRVRSEAVQSARWSEWLLCGGLLALSWFTVRNAFLCLLPLCFMLRSLPPRWLARRERLLAALGSALLLLALHDHVEGGYGGLEQARQIVREDLAPNAFPEQLTSFMREARIEGKMLNDGRWGGFLIWQLWPACHVFVDTRQDLTAEMWPLFLASQHAGSRPAALQAVHEKWGLELAVFRGPTFPIITAPAEWLLLFKAGDQELYQHRAGDHAASNFARARAWLATRTSASALASDYAAAASEVGAARWLAAPAQLRQHTRAQQQLESADPLEQQAGQFAESELAFDAGRYAEAFARLSQLVSAPSPTALALYRYALTAHVLSQPARAGWALGQLSSRTHELSPAQLGRLSVLARALR